MQGCVYRSCKIIVSSLPTIKQKFPQDGRTLVFLPLIWSNIVGSVPVPPSHVNHEPNSATGMEVLLFVWISWFRWVSHELRGVLLKNQWEKRPHRLVSNRQLLGTLSWTFGGIPLVTKILIYTWLLSHRIHAYLLTFTNKNQPKCK